MTMNSKRILVTGATGQQGGAVARHLSKQEGFRVRALTRDTTKPAAKALAQQGAELVQGNLDDAASLGRALEGVYGVFSVQNFMETGYEGEIRQGKALADAARTAGVQHFIYSSVVSADRKTGLPHFESKWHVEKHTRQIALPFTIVRPGFFMENWRSFMGEQITQGTLSLPLNPQTSLQQVSTEDIGAIVALAFQNPGKWQGRTVELAGDELTMKQVADVFTRVLGRRVNYVQMPWERFQEVAGEEMTRMYRWFETTGYHVDIAALRREHPTLATLEQTLRQQDWSAAQFTARKAA